MENKKALLLVNIGSPDSHDEELKIQHVKKYLKEFLMDPEVIKAPFLIRWLIVNLFIVPFRSKQSWQKYKKIWLNQGSPLIVDSLRVAQLLEQKLGIPVHMGMRYGSHKISKAMDEIQKIFKQNSSTSSELIVFFMYPQYADSTTLSSQKEIEKIYRAKKSTYQLKWIPSYSNDPKWISLWRDKIKNHLNEGTHLIMSYHGLPESHIKKDPTCSFKNDNDWSCCENKLQHNTCYRAQCYQTSLLIAESLNLKKIQYANQWTMSFQSRLGPVKWLGPATEEVLIHLAKQGKSVVVVAPSFVTDCLETLEEINIELRKIFLQHGGQSFKYISSLNTEDSWVDYIQQKLDQ